MNIRRYALLCCFSFVVPVAAQDAPSASAPVASVYVPASPLERERPRYPSRAYSQRREGWAQVSFVISKEGEVIEPMIERSSHADFDQPTLRAIRGWRYQPATVDGEPVEQSMVQTIIRYQLDGTDGASGVFVAKFRRIDSLIRDGKLEEAESLIAELEQGQLNFYEVAWLGWLWSVYLDTKGDADPEALKRSLGRALIESETGVGSYLEPDVFVLASQRLYALHVESAEYGSAVTVFEHLQAATDAQRESKLYGDVLASLGDVQRRIMQLVAGPRVMRLTGRIDSSSYYWVHRLLRREFALGDVQGGYLELVDVRCSQATRRFPATADATFKIPESWGDCSVYIKGDAGATFAFEEYPSSAVNAVETMPAAQ